MWTHSQNRNMEHNDSETHGFFLGVLVCCIKKPLRFYDFRGYKNSGCCFQYEIDNSIGNGLPELIILP